MVPRYSVCLRSIIRKRRIPVEYSLFNRKEARDETEQGGGLSFCMGESLLEGRL